MIPTFFSGLGHLLERGHVIYGIVSSNPNILNWANTNGIEALNFSDGWISHLRSNKYEYLFSIANLLVLPDEVINSPKKCAINYHDGPLPKYGGVNVTSWAIMDQRKTHGVTWHEIINEVDKGDILKQVFFDVTENETALSLNIKCFEQAFTTFADLISELESGTNKPIKQNFYKRTYFGKYKRPSQAAIINWNRSAEEISAFIRALDFGPYKNPLGLPKTKAGSEYFIITNIVITDIESTDSPGLITSIENGKIRVATKTKDIEINQSFSIDGIPLNTKELVDRYSLNVGIRFDTLNNNKGKAITKFYKGCM